MAYKQFVVALCMIAASPVSAGQPEPITGSRIETTRCETRQEWARLEVDLDKEWPKEGVRVIG